MACVMATIPGHDASVPRGWCPGFSLLTVAWALNGRELDGIRQAAGGAEANGNDGHAQRHRPLEQRGQGGWFGAKMGRFFWGKPWEFIENGKHKSFDQGKDGIYN